MCPYVLFTEKNELYGISVENGGQTTVLRSYSKIFLHRSYHMGMGRHTKKHGNKIQWGKSIDNSNFYLIDQIKFVTYLISIMFVFGQNFFLLFRFISSSWDTGMNSSDNLTFHSQCKFCFQVACFGLLKKTQKVRFVQLKPRMV